MSITRTVLFSAPPLLLAVHGGSAFAQVGSYNYWETGIMEETISSFRVGTAVNLLVCRERDFFKCNSYRAGSTVPQVSARPAENDTISSFSVIP